MFADSGKIQNFSITNGDLWVEEKDKQTLFFRTPVDSFGGNFYRDDPR